MVRLQLLPPLDDAVRILVTQSNRLDDSVGGAMAGRGALLEEVRQRAAFLEHTRNLVKVRDPARRELPWS